MTGAREGRRGGARAAMSRVVAGGIGMLGWRQVTPRWTDDPVQRNVGGGGVGEVGGFPLPRRKSGSGKRGRGGSSKPVRNN